MQSVENNSVRVRNPLFVSTAALAIAALLISSGCRTKDPAASTEAVGAPPTAILPPAPKESTTVLVPPPAEPDFRMVEPPASTKTHKHVEPASGISYTVKNGDSLSLIAARHGVSAREIAEINGISNPNKIRVGQKIKLPIHAKARAYTPKKTVTKTTTAKKPASSAASATPAAPVNAGGEYVVKSGDSISKIAMNHRVKQKDLLAVNNLTSDKLKIGQKLKIPGAGDVAAPVAAPAVEATPVTADPLLPPPAVTPVTPDAGVAPAVAPALTPDAGAAAPAPMPTVQTFEVSVDPGDTIDTISQKYGVLPAEIKKLNNISEVAPGQRIKLPLPTP